VTKWLSDESNGRWLMIIDNADDKDIFLTSPSSAAPLNKTKNKQAGLVGTPARDLGRLLPQTLNGSYLITSREKSVAVLLAVDHADIINTDPMSDTESLTLLTKKLVGSYDQEDAKQLVEKLDFMPLAITQAAAYINQNAPRATIPKYLALLAKGDSDRAKLLSENVPDSRRDGSRSNSCIATWHISFERIQQLRPSAARLLSLMSLFNREGVWEDLLVGQYTALEDKRPMKWWHKTHKRLSRRKKQKGKDKGIMEAKIEESPEETFEHDWHVLNDFSLIATAADGVHFAMHSLVQYSTKKWLEIRGMLKAWERRYVFLIHSLYPADLTSDVEYPLSEALKPHLQRAMHCVPAYDEMTVVWLDLMFRFAPVAQDGGAWEAAEFTYKSLMTTFGRMYGEGDARVIACGTRLCMQLLLQKSKYTEAEAIYRDMLRMQQETLGPQHLDTLRMMTYLGDALSKQHKRAEAEALYKEEMKVRQQIYGFAHDETQWAVGQRTIHLLCEGKPANLLAFERDCFETRKDIVGNKHDGEWHDALVGRGLSATLGGDFQKAEDVFSELLDYCEKTLGENDEKVSQSMRWLAEAYTGQERYPEAEKMYRRVEDFVMRTSDKQNEDVLFLKLELARVLREQDKLKDAEEYARMAVAGYNEVLGKENDYTAFAKYILATILHRQKCLEEALLMYEEAYPILKSAGGDEQGDTKSCLKGLTMAKKELADTRAKEPPKIKIHNTHDLMVSLKESTPSFTGREKNVPKLSPFLLHLLRPVPLALRRSRSSISCRYTHHSTLQYRVSAPGLLVVG
jgi:tetratricopeptide (TPR) repeat protein